MIKYLSKANFFQFLVIWTLLFYQEAAAQPSNDDCAAATALTVNPGQICTSTGSGTTTGATASTTAGQPSCDASSADDDVWFKFAATAVSHVVEVTGNSPMYFPRMELYAGTCGNLTSLGTCITSGSSSVAAIRYDGLTIGDTYFVRVYSFSTNSGYRGPFSICVSSITNDECGGAVNLNIGSNCNATFGNTVFTTQSTTSGQPLCGSHTGWNDDDLWFKFTTPASPAAGYTATIDATSFISGTQLTAPNMSIYTGTCGNLTLVSNACTSPGSGSCTYLQNANLTSVLPNTNYYIRVYSWVSAASYRGKFNICVKNSGGAASLSVNPSSLNFGSLCVGDSSILSFTVTGANLGSGNITVGPLTGFEFSLNNSTFATSQSITSCGGSLSQIVYVKFKPTSGQSYNGNIIISGGGATATSVTVAATGSSGVAANKPVLDATLDTICAGGSVTLSVLSGNLNGASNWQWYTGSCGGVVAGSGTFITVTPLNSITYYARGIGNCVAPGACDSIRITINSGTSPAVLISVNPTGAACFGSPVTFTALPSNGGNTPSYQWKVNGSNQGINSSTFSSSSFNNGDVVTCVITSSNVCAFPATSTSNSITVSLLPTVVPDVTISSDASGAVCAGTSVTFTAIASNGGTSPVYQWKLNGNNIGASSNSFSSGYLNNGDVVSCVLTSNVACATPQNDTSNSIAVSIIAPLTPSVTITANPQGAVCPGTVITFTATPVNGGSNPQFVWKRNGSIVGGNNAVYSSGSLSNGDVIICELTNNDACTTTSTATSNNVVVLTSTVITPTISINVSPNDSVCQGTPVTFTAATSGEGTSPTYIWKVNGNTVGGNTSSFTTNTPNNNDVVICQVSSSESCANPTTVNSNALTLHVTPLVIPTLSISANPSGSVCSGTEIIFTAQVNNGGTAPIIDWRVNGVSTGNNGGSFAISTLNNGDNVTCNITSNAVCASPSTASSNSLSVIITDITNDVNITGSGGTLTATESGAQYQWLLCPEKSPINGATLQSFTPTSPGSYACVILKDGCTDTSNCTEIIINNVISIKDEISATVYPNPFSDMLIIDIHNDVLLNGSIYDLTGRLIDRILLSQGKNMFSFTSKGLEDGVYFLSFESEGFTRSYRLIHAK